MSWVLVLVLLPVGLSFLENLYLNEGNLELVFHFPFLISCYLMLYLCFIHALSMLYPWLCYAFGILLPDLAWGKAVSNAPIGGLDAAPSRTINQLHLHNLPPFVQFSLIPCLPFLQLNRPQMQFELNKNWRRTEQELNKPLFKNENCHDLTAKCRHFTANRRHCFFFTLQNLILHHTAFQPRFAPSPCAIWQEKAPPYGSDRQLIGSWAFCSEAGTIRARRDD
jgi:hypothetical protein